FGLAGDRIAGKTGVWVRATGDESGTRRVRKIASIGIGVRRWVTCHGVALNVSTDLDYFRAIVPCGIDGVEMTTIARGVGDPVERRAVERALVEEFTNVFEGTPEEAEKGAVPKRGRNYAARISAAEPGVSGDRKPPWLRARVPSGESYFRTRRILSDLEL